MTSPIRPFRFLCLVCGEPLHRLGSACPGCGAKGDGLEEDHDLSVRARTAEEAPAPVACWAHAAVLMPEVRRGAIYVAVGILVGVGIAWILR